MKKFRIKPEMIGVKTSSKTIGGQIKVTQAHAEMFAREGRMDLVEELVVKKLIPVEKLDAKPKSKSDLSGPK